MSARANSPAARGPIFLLQDDRPQPDAARATAFDEAPFASLSSSTLLPQRTRLVDDADGWARWRTQRLELEQALVVHESCRSLDPETAERMRDRLTEMERRVCDVRPEEILSELSALQRKVRADLGDLDG